MKPYPVGLIEAGYDEAYGKSEIELSYLRDGDGKYHSFRRCGCTPPHYPDRACYMETGHDGEFGPVYVLDGRRLWLSSEWHAYYREHGVTPAGGLA